MSAPDFGARADAIVEDAYWGSRNQDDTLADILSLIAEVREAVAREIEAERAKVDAEIERGVYRYGSAVEPGSVDPFLTERSDAYSASARIARGSNA